MPRSTTPSGAGLSEARHPVGWSPPKIVERDTDAEVRRRLSQMINERYGSQSAYALAKGVSGAFVSNALSGRRPVPSWMAADVGATLDRAGVRAEQSPRKAGRRIGVMTPARLRYSRKLLSGPSVAGLLGCDTRVASEMVEAGFWEARDHRWPGGRTKIYALTPAGRRALAEGGGDADPL